MLVVVNWLLRRVFEVVSWLLRSVFALEENSFEEKGWEGDSC